MPVKRLKCPYCPSEKFGFGEITIGQNGSVKAVYCVRCGRVVSCLEATLHKPASPQKGQGVSFAQVKGL